MRLAGRMAHLTPSPSFTTLARAKAMEAAGHDIIHLEVGEPDFDTPANVVEAGVAALRGGHTRYTPAAGEMALRSAIARHVGDTRDVDVAPTQILVAPGGKPVIYYTIMALVEAGDEVILPDPTFPSYATITAYAGATPVHVPLDAERGFAFDVDAFAAALSPRTRLVVLNSPSNPTGAVLSADDLAAIARLLADRPDVVVLADEIYSRMVYDGVHRSILTESGMAERTVVLDGFSKTYAMTGWRLGYAVLPPALAPILIDLQSNITSCAADATQVAGLAALDGPQADVEAMVHTFRSRRDRVVARLNELPGIRCALPAGAFYAFPDIRGTGLDDLTLADELLTHTGVALLAGRGFGPAGAGHLRLSYANAMSNLDRALDRMGEHLTTLARAGA
ncbi:MAG: pyridoxal phosphate-dependent aminotransferase [Ardenticatenales bacterium]|nr:pyridoxal phosphate-dependent aminotransferase [Ardenticatenales bacterium]